MKSSKRHLMLTIMCLCLCFILAGCNNYSRLFRAIGNRMTAGQTEETQATTRQTTATTRPTISTAASVTPTETTTVRTEQTTTPVTTTSTTSATSTTGTTSKVPDSIYTVVDGFSYEEGSVIVYVPYIMPEDAASAPLNEALAIRAADEQTIVTEGLDEDIYYELDYFYQFDGNCLTLALESIVGWIDSEGYYSYDVYHYDFDTRSFLDNTAYLAYLGLGPDLIDDMVQSYYDANLDPELFEIRPVAEALFVIFDDVLYYEVISIEYEDFWLEEIGSISP
ncbi:MAG: hypothetical protein SCM11_03680 [Bacillota bacterium]|nr:hypothetical protein [Bacillota bacterium]